MKQNRAVLLMNLGSPDSTETTDVKRYLTEFLMDKRVLDFSYLWRSFLVNGLIVPFRAEKSAAAYRSVWTKNGSPLIVLTCELQLAVQQQLDLPVEIVMRYGNPSSDKILKKLSAENPDLQEIVLLPLYPHYAMSSYETAVEDIKSANQKGKYHFNLTTIKPYYNNEFYIEALANSVKPYIQKDFDKILFSYHGLPERHILKSDVTGNHCLQITDCCHVPSEAHKYCYRHQTTITTEMVAGMLQIPAEKVEQSFQSRLGRSQWLTPYTVLRLQQLPQEGVKRLLIICPAFVSDCLETLEEIAIEGKEIFMQAGGESFTLIPCLNTQPLWVNSITKWIKDYIAGNKEMVLN